MNDVMSTIAGSNEVGDMYCRSKDPYDYEVEVRDEITSEWCHCHVKDAPRDVQEVRVFRNAKGYLY